MTALQMVTVFRDLVAGWPHVTRTSEPWGRDPDMKASFTIDTEDGRAFQVEVMSVVYKKPNVGGYDPYAGL